MDTKLSMNMWLGATRRYKWQGRAETKEAPQKPQKRSGGPPASATFGLAGLKKMPDLI